MMAPVSRRDVLLRPVAQRLRSMAFDGALAGGIAGQLAARRLPGLDRGVDRERRGHRRARSASPSSPPPTIAHALRVPRWVATVLGAALIGTQMAAAVWRFPGPGDGIGSLALWGMRTHLVDLVSVAVIVVARSCAALALADRLRAGTARRAGPTSCPSSGSPSRCRTCAPSCCCAASSAASGPGRRRGSGSVGPARRTRPVRCGSATSAGWRATPRRDSVRMASLAVIAGLLRRVRARGHDAAPRRHRHRAVPARARRDRAAVAGDRPSRLLRRDAAASGAGCTLRHFAAPRSGAGAVRPRRRGDGRRRRARPRPRRARPRGAGGVGRRDGIDRQRRPRRPEPGRAVGDAAPRCRPSSPASRRRCGSSCRSS